MTASSDQKFTFFWQDQSPFSNFHPSPFRVDNNQFSCNEQFMMYSKAKLFGDDEAAEKILAETKPKSMKALGRKVKNFDNDVWIQNRERIVKQGLREKFGQNAHLMDELMRTGDTELAEASPFDRIWGIGMAATNPAAQDKSQWKGLNLLGKLLTEVRDELRNNQKMST